MASLPSLSIARLSFAWRLGLLYAALFLVVGCYLPYLPVWLSWRRLGADQIAVLLAAPLFTRILFTPAISFAADRLGDRRKILIGLAWGSLISFLLLWAADGFFTMLLATMLLAINWTTIMPLIETVAVSGIRFRALDYGRVRLWGSISFIVASLGAGFVIGRVGPGVVMPLLVAAAALVILGVHLLPRGAHGVGVHADSRAARAETERCGRSLPRAAFSLVPARGKLRAGKPRALLQLRLAALAGARHSRRRDRRAVVGGRRRRGRVVRGLGPRHCLLRHGAPADAGGACGGLALGLHGDRPAVAATALLQTLHAMSFGAAHLAAIHFMTHAVPSDRAATAQGLYAAVVAGLVLGLVTIACGPLYRTFAGEAYAAMAMLALIGAGCAYLLMQRWRGGLVAGAMDRTPAA